jgi:hypothetical protein
MNICKSMHRFNQQTAHLFYVVERCDAHVSADCCCSWDLVDAAAGVAPLRGLQRAAGGKAVPVKAATAGTV